MKLNVMDDQLGCHVLHTRRRNPDVGAATGKTIRTELTKMFTCGNVWLPGVGNVFTQTLNERFVNGPPCELMSSAKPADCPDGWARIHLAVSRKIGIEHQELPPPAIGYNPIGCHAVLNSTVSRIQYGFSAFAVNQSFGAREWLE
jgi:hypothetical protein